MVKTIVFLLITFISSLVHANTGNVCYVKRNNQWIYQIKAESKTLGSVCYITNGSFVPVYEGRIGTCVKNMDCSNVGNTAIQN